MEVPSDTLEGFFDASQALFIAAKAAGIIPDIETKRGGFRRTSWKSLDVAFQKPVPPRSSDSSVPNRIFISSQRLKFLM
jgi:hypothetical protein